MGASAEVRAVLGVTIAAAFALAPALRAQAPFTEEALARGIDYIAAQNLSFGCGVGFVDLDEDGDPDLVVTGRADGVPGMYENDGTGTFIDRTGSVPPMLLPSGVVAADYDGDRDLDLYFSNYQARNYLMRNEGGFLFSDVTYAAGVADEQGWGEGCAWADYDGDGWIDLYVGNRTQPDQKDSPPNRLYRNLGDGTFVDMAGPLGVDGGVGLTLQATFFDFDRNGYPDIYLCTDKSLDCENQINRLFQNLGGTFVEITESSGAGVCIGCMGTAHGDFDGNGLIDIYCTNTENGNVCLVNQGDGTFVDVAPVSGTASYRFAWGTLFLDHDNDGREDLYVCNDPLPNGLYDVNGIWPVQDVAAAMDVDTPGPSYCVATADLEGDGDFDLLVQNWNERIRLYVNHNGETRNWLKIDLLGEWPNTHAVGAQVEVTVGSTTRMKENMAGIGFKSVSSSILHFGLNTATMVDRIDVHWPGGGGAVTTLTNVPANQTLVVRQVTPLPVTRPLRPTPP
jgi:hypothetical protein